MRVKRIDVAHIRAPLVSPYQLSFTTLEAFESVVVTIERSDGAIGVGEAVALPGYGSETVSSILKAVADIVAGSIGMPIEALTERARDKWQHAPFAASAVVTASELPDWFHHAGRDVGFALNAAIAPAAHTLLANSAERLLDGGYRHLKLKIGRSVSEDTTAARWLLEHMPSRSFQLVLDANQAYSLSAAQYFIRALAEMRRTRLLWLEQPIHRDDWAGMEILCRGTDLPIVLDECIYNEADIRRAASMGARGVKLKSFKNFGLAETIRLSEVARSLGLFVVFGNGVATDLGNLAEFLTLASAPSYFREPSESSGFAKLRRPVSASGLGLAVDRGCFVCRSTAAKLVEELAGLRLRQ